MISKQPLEIRKVVQSRHDFYKILAMGDHFQVKLKSETYHRNIRNIFQNSLYRKSCYEIFYKIKVSIGVYILKIARMYSFSGALKLMFYSSNIFSKQTKVVNENTESISRSLCKTQTLKSTPTPWFI